MVASGGFDEVQKKLLATGLPFESVATAKSVTVWRGSIKSGFGLIVIVVGATPNVAVHVSSLVSVN
jgi:hypothetical protein